MGWPNNQHLGLHPSGWDYLVGDGSAGGACIGLRGASRACKGVVLRTAVLALCSWPALPPRPGDTVLLVVVVIAQSMRSHQRLLQSHLVVAMALITEDLREVMLELCESLR